MLFAAAASLLALSWRLIARLRSDPANPVAALRANAGISPLTGKPIAQAARFPPSLAGVGVRAVSLAVVCFLVAQVAGCVVGRGVRRRLVMPCSVSRWCCASAMAPAVPALPPSLLGSMRSDRVARGRARL